MLIHHAIACAIVWLWVWVAHKLFAWPKSTEKASKVLFFIFMINLSLQIPVAGILVFAGLWAVNKIGAWVEEEKI